MTLFATMLLVNTDFNEQPSVVRTPPRMRTNYDNVPPPPKKDKRKSNVRNYQNNSQPRTLRF